MADILLQIDNVTKRYRQGTRHIDALRGVTLSIYRGEILSLLGVNGAGKTTLSSIIASLHPATSGNVLFQGQSIYDDIISYRKVLGFCPQKPNFEKSLTVQENLIFAGRYYCMDSVAICARVNQLMDQFELKQYADAMPDILSGGFKQRLLIARTLMHNPLLVILDEPTVGMDPHIRRELWGYINALKAEGITVILTTHYLDEAEALSDRVCILDKGVVRFLDTPENLKAAHAKKNLEEVFIHLIDESKKRTEQL